MWLYWLLHCAFFQKKYSIFCSIIICLFVQNVAFVFGERGFDRQNPLFLSFSQIGNWSLETSIAFNPSNLIKCGFSLRSTRSSNWQQTTFSANENLDFLPFKISSIDLQTGLDIYLVIFTGLLLKQVGKNKHLENSDSQVPQLSHTVHIKPRSHCDHLLQDFSNSLLNQTAGRSSICVNGIRMKYQGVNNRTVLSCWCSKRHLFPLFIHN